MFSVSRNTVQNWESGASALPSTLSMGCEVWNDRLKKQTAELGPVTLFYADGPMFIDPYGPRRGRPAALHQEPYPTNAAALARVRILWNDPDFHGPFIIEKSGEPLWNQVELKNVVTGKDQGAPTTRNTLAKIAKYIEANAEAYAKDARSRPTPQQIEERNNKVRAIAAALMSLSAASETRTVQYEEFEVLLAQLHELGFFPTNRHVGDVAHAIEGERVAGSYAA
jgi:hypothetical protein